MKNCESLKSARNNTFEGGNRSFEIPKNTLAKTVILNSKTLPSYTKLDTILYLPYLKPLRQKLQKLHLVDRGYEEKIAAFTLAETLITLTILGVVAAITIPALINKYNESANRTKLKKAMAAYEKALNQMIIDNDIKGTITAAEGFGIGECDMSSSYFKPVEVITVNKCRFKTADKVGYDITDITHPIFFLSDDYKTADLETASTGLRALAKDTDNKDVFGGVGNIQDGIVRINDKGAATGDDATILNKSYAFMNNEAVEEPIDSNRACSDSTKNGEGKYFSCIKNDSDGVNKCLYNSSGVQVACTAFSQMDEGQYDDERGYGANFGCFIGNVSSEEQVNAYRTLGLFCEKNSNRCNEYYVSECENDDNYACYNYIYVNLPEPNNDEGE